MTSKKFKNKYRIESTRLKGYDYSSNGAYFITIVTKNRFHFFGEIKKYEMQLSEIGKIVWEQWFESEKIRNNILLDQFVVMPNHIHAVVVIDNGLSDCRDVVPQHLYNGPQRIRNYDGPNKKMSDISPLKSSLSHMVREFKTAVTKRARIIIPTFAWQANYHDRIVRNNDELNRIRKYIIENPQKWELDRNKKGIWS